MIAITFNFLMLPVKTFLWVDIQNFIYAYGKGKNISRACNNVLKKHTEKDKY